jgi:hypothetical protein
MKHDRVRLCRCGTGILVRHPHCKFCTVVFCLELILCAGVFGYVMCGCYEWHECT